MSNLNVIIVEDEYLASKLIKKYVEKIPFLTYRETFINPFEAIDFLKEQSIDVIFLDIHLPQLTGIEFIKRLEKPYQIILTTAYHQYALTSYEYNVVDYLLKPIEFDRFLVATQKLQRQKSEFIQINVNKSIIQINFNDIIFLESKRDYLVFTLKDGIQYKTKKTISSCLNVLPKNFIRVHKSFIINITFIRKIGKSEIDLNHYFIPIGRKYKENLSEFL